jgi:hypothetical protein
MTKLEKLEREIEELTPEARAALREWFFALDDAEWDAKFERDANPGALDELADEALADHRAERSRPI